MQFGWGYNHVYTQVGDWSNTETIKIEGNTTQNPTVTPVASNPNGIQGAATFGLSWEQIVIAVMAVAVAVLTAGLAVLWRRLPRK